MKSDVIVITSRGEGMEDALRQAEKTAAFAELSPKSAMHLRLLTEEMLGMVRSITGKVSCEYWIESKGQAFELHLHTSTQMNDEKRRQLLAASSTGKNEAARGIMGKIRTFFDPLDEVPVFFSASPDGTYTDMYGWSLRSYEKELEFERAEHREGAEEAWDELEMSIVSAVADDVKVSIRGRDVDMVIYKTVR